ncbi:calcium/proton exchanger [Trichocladium antarcticum]|uniref:Calcium/proton exchanger n=1 Tax=Trichocladium antarcticum TaxID=1450529 RepID=A0AAN6UHJ2_9PEZI|nr:calcium/proton exchanger [Trichocladium antarcticum]
MRFVLTAKAILVSSIINVLLVFVPVGIAVHFAKMPAGVIFAMNAVAIVPLAGLLSHATESVASRLGDTVGALLNVTFGNAVELIIFIIALIQNHIRIVQASLVGSILANLLLILGMCFLLGGLRYREQVYNSTVTQMSACLLALSVTSLLLPTAFHASFSDATTANDKVLQVSRGTSVIILLVYLLYLVFQLKTHSYMYVSTPQHVIERETAPGPAAHYFNPSEREPTIEGSDTVAASPVSSGLAGVGPMEGVDAIVPVCSAPTIDTTNEAVEKISRPAREHHKHPHTSRHHRRHSPGGNRGTRAHETNPSPPEHLPSQETGRADFAAGSALEAQSEPPQPRPRSILTLRPSIANVHPTSHTTAALLLIISTALIAICANFMVSSIDNLVAADPGLSEAFIGLILLPLVGNAAEHVTAVSVAWKNKMDLAIGVAVGSSIQIALFVTPLVVILGWAMGKDMGLFFTLFETVCVFVSAFIVNFLVLDGRSNYLEGALLCAGYTIIALAAFFYPDAAAANSLGGGD